ncbi:RHS repeat-associated core domain-containing protein [Pseudomonas sp. FYR_11]|uniref:RHS repeat-associated core domain-containing protein n=1 Tax=Pseudomonas TaxID=286 RepID=UPI00370C3D08
MSTPSTSKNAQGLAPQRSLHFYKNGHLATEVATLGNRHVLWANDVVLAQLDQSQTAKVLRVDFANSVLGSASGSAVYSPYGYLATEKLQALLGFNGQWCDSRTHGYPLGAGRRLYNPALMRFCSIDPLSPFDKGGLHPAAYCGGDPINRTDPSGRFFQRIRKLFAPTPTPPATFATIANLADNKLVSIAFDIPLIHKPRAYTPPPSKKPFLDGWLGVYKDSDYTKVPFDGDESISRKPQSKQVSVTPRKKPNRPPEHSEGGSQADLGTGISKSGIRDDSRLAATGILIFSGAIGAVGGAIYYMSERIRND